MEHDYAADAPVKVEGLCAALDAAGLRPRSVLEVGCGTGGVVAGVCARLGVPGVGVDPSADAVAVARARHPGVRFEVGTAGGPERADLVLCVDVIEHVADEAAFLAALRGHGRWFLFRIPLDGAAWDRVRGRTARFAREYGHLRVYTWRGAVRALRSAGFDVRATRLHRVPAGGPVGRGVRRAVAAAAPRFAAAVVGGYSLIALARAAPAHDQTGSDGGAGQSWR